jgi:hypothetical protein
MINDNLIQISPARSFWKQQPDWTELVSPSEVFLYSAFHSIIHTGRLVDPQKWTVQDAICKLGEESGELSAAIQTKVGKLDKPYNENDDFDETADVIMCAVDALSQANLDVPHQLLIAGIIDAIHRKLPKWEEKIIRTKIGKDEQ